MDVFIAGKAHAAVRRAGHEDRLVEVTPKAPILALQVNDYAEVHLESGAVTRVSPGGYVVEWPDGTVQGMERDVFLETFLEPDADAVAAKLDTAPPMVGQALSAPVVVESKASLEVPSEEEAEKMTPAEIQAKLAEQAREAEQLISDWAKAAVDGQLISVEEANAWVETGELPEGVSVVKEGDGWQVSREPGAQAEDTTGAEGATEPAADEDAAEDDPSEQ